MRVRLVSRRSSVYIPSHYLARIRYMCRCSARARARVPTVAQLLVFSHARIILRADYFLPSIILPVRYIANFARCCFPPTPRDSRKRIPEYRSISVNIDGVVCRKKSRPIIQSREERPTVVGWKRAGKTAFPRDENPIVSRAVMPPFLMIISVTFPETRFRKSAPS